MEQIRSRELTASWTGPTRGLGWKQKTFDSAYLVQGSAALVQSRIRLGLLALPIYLRRAKLLRSSARYQI